jgi:hypothetical protein
MKTMYCVRGLLTTAILLVLTYIDVSATAVGMSANFSFYLIAIANASSGFGRIISGVVSDRVGAYLA